MADLPLPSMVAIVLSFAGAALAFIFVGVLLRFGTDSKLGSRLVALLVADGVLMAAIGLDAIYEISASWNGPRESARATTYF
jgi:hypothetical protein